MTTAFIMRLFIFILLGDQVDFGLMGQHLVGGIVVVTILMLLARPVTVFLCALPDRRAALAGLLLGMKAPGAQMIASVTFIAVLMTILIQSADNKMAGEQVGACG